MKWIIISVCLLGLALFILFLINPMIALAASGPAIQVEAEVKKETNGYRASLKLINTDQVRYLTEFSLDKQTAAASGLKAPVGYRVEPLPYDRSEQEWTDEWNNENVRFVGSLLLKPNELIELFLPCKDPELAIGKIQCTYETKKKFGNMMSFFTIPLSSDEADPVDGGQ
jgi:hypothetical protein